MPANVVILVLGIIAIVTIGKVLSARYKAMHGIVADKEGNERPIADPDAIRLRDEVKALKERIHVLERIATEERGSRDLSLEIDKLRDR